MANTSCTKCGKHWDERLMMRFSPNDPGLKRLRDARLCLECVEAQAAEFRSHNCLMCQNTADMLDSGKKMLEEYVRTGAPQVEEVAPKTRRVYAHDTTCPLATT